MTWRHLGPSGSCSVALDPPRGARGPAWRGLREERTQCACQPTTALWLSQAKSLRAAASAMCRMAPFLSICADFRYAFLIWCDLYSMTITFLALVSLLPQQLTKLHQLAMQQTPFPPLGQTNPAFPGTYPAALSDLLSSHLGPFSFRAVCVQGSERNKYSSGVRARDAALCTLPRVGGGISVRLHDGSVTLQLAFLKETPPPSRVHPALCCPPAVGEALLQEVVHPQGGLPGMAPL